MVSKETIANLATFTDAECAQALLLGIAKMLQAKVEAVYILQFAEELVAAIRLAEAIRVNVRDEGAN
jgi:hypothetical protein